MTLLWTIYDALVRSMFPNSLPMRRKLCWHAIRIKLTISLPRFLSNFVWIFCIHFFRKNYFFPFVGLAENLLFRHWTTACWLSARRILWTIRSEYFLTESDYFFLFNVTFSPFFFTQYTCLIDGIHCTSLCNIYKFYSLSVFKICHINFDII